MKVQVFGQFKLEEHIGNNGNTFSQLISIGNPGLVKFLKSPDYIMPPQFKKHFKRILRLEFYDVEAIGQLQNPKNKNQRMPRKSDQRYVPHRQMVKWFDEIPGSDLHNYANLIHKQFIYKYLEGLEPDF